MAAKSQVGKKLFKVSIMLFIIFFSFSAFKQTTEWKAPSKYDKLVNPYSNDDKAVKSGKKIYQSLCWTCHGLTGQGDGPAGKILDPKPANHTSDAVKNQSDGALYWKISTGRGEMQAYGKLLSKTERWQLVTFIRQLAKT